MININPLIFAQGDNIRPSSKVYEAVIETNATIRHVETATIDITTGAIIPSADSDDYAAYISQADQSIPTIESYYFSSKGNLLGLIPKSRMIVKIDGPFTSFHATTRVLRSVTGEACRLPAGKEETTNMPKLLERTKKELKRLTTR